MKTGIVPICLAVVAATMSAGPGHAQSGDDRRFQFAAGVSIAGAQIEASYRFRPKWAVRGFLGGGLTVFGDGSVAGVDYDWNVQLGGAGLMTDYYPWTDGFRISGGLFVPGTNVTGRANGDLEIGDGFFEGVSIEGNVSPVSDVLPLVSIGYVQPLTKDIFLTADIGAILTEGFRINLSGSAGSSIPSDDLNMEEQQFRAQAWDAFPFIALGVAYRF